MSAIRSTFGSSLVGWALSTAMLLSVSAFAQPVPRQQAAVDPLVRLNESMDALTKKVWPSVVQILVSGFGPQEGPPGGVAIVGDELGTAPRARRDR